MKNKKKFVVADLHLGHPGVCKFLGPDGKTPLRPWDNTTDMDEALIENWNSVVGPDDETYVLGDVVLSRKALPTIARLNGRKHLIKGNHDIFRINEYLEYFYEVSACKVLKEMILTHIPVHTSQLDRFKFNVHGHLHAYKVMKSGTSVDREGYYSKVEDPRYMCVSVEQTDFKPVALDEIREELSRRQRYFPELFGG